MGPTLGLLFSLSALGPTTASAQPEPEDLRKTQGDLQLSPLGRVHYVTTYQFIGGDHAYTAIKVYWSGALAEGQTLYEGVIDIPPAKVQATARGICVSASQCAPKGENCSRFYIGYAYSENSNEFIEQEDASLVCDDAH